MTAAETAATPRVGVAGRRWLTGIAGVLALAAILMVELPFTVGSLREGQPSPETFRVPADRTVIDESATERARQQAIADVEPVPTTDVAANTAMVSEVTEFFDLLDTVTRSSAGLTIDERYTRLVDRYPSLGTSHPDGLRRMVELEVRDLLAARRATIERVLSDRVVQQQITEENLPGRRNEVRLAFSDPLLGLEPSVAQLLATFVSGVMRPNQVADAEATEAARAAAAARVQPVEVTLRRGQVVVERGERLSAEQVELLGLIGLGAESLVPRGVALAMFAALVMVVAAVWVRTARPHIWHQPRRLAMLVTLLGGFAAISVAFALLARNGNVLWGYMIPIATLAMLTCILVDAGAAIVMVLVAAVLIGVTTHGNFTYAAVAAVAGLVPIPFVSDLSSRGTIMSATWRAALGAGSAAFVFDYAADPSRDAVLAAVAGGVQGAVAGFVTIGLLPLFENLFDVLTPTRLLDLTDRNHPLLRLLEDKAIGTYNHSILVGTLAERAARRIGANGLLSRAAAYYHDIGKTQRAPFFVENQLTGDNPHDRITPEQSADIIKEHVTDGMKLAAEHRIPAEVAEGIVTHHGTGRIQYFLSKASEDGEVVDEDVFRHVGHKPRSREMGILMLADSCEGAVRALAQNHAHRVKPEDVAERVDMVVRQKVEDGQLDECPITFSDLTEIRESFTETLVSIYHPRIEYPPMPARSDRGARGSVVAGDPAR